MSIHILVLLAVLALLQLMIRLSHILTGIHYDQSLSGENSPRQFCSEKFFTPSLISGCDVKWSTDNLPVPSIVHFGSMKEHLHILALDIFQTTKDNNIDIEVEWIPPTQNERTDYSSKIVDYDDCTVKD